MDLEKIGSFIQERRKLKGLTQLELANVLHVTDRAISKWECGRSMPDSSIMLDLCKVLEISVNELLTGEVLEMNDYSKQAEMNLLEAVKNKEESDRMLLRMEILIGIIAIIIGITPIFVAAFVSTLETWQRVLLIVGGFLMFIPLILVALRIEQKAGYYECQECHHRYVPTFWQALMAPHAGRSRKMKCPHCGKRNYHKKVISKE
ncbi:MAG: helix-turn-helix transcriptional regulator [Bacilli bacterium]|nr:helix-turn-helix transcriptional regulator [Bacilli bacterium]